MQTRREIAEAALELFARDGYDSVAVGAIAEHAGVSLRTFYHYFPTKDDVLSPISRDTIGDFVPLVAARPVVEDLATAVADDVAAAGRRRTRRATRPGRPNQRWSGRVGSARLGSARRARAHGAVGPPAAEPHRPVVRVLECGAGHLSLPGGPRPGQSAAIDDDATEWWPTAMYQPGGQGADRLRRLLAAPSILPLPTAHDALSAWSCEMAGFEALLLSRASVGLSALATEDAAAVDDSLLVAQAARVCQVVSLPVVVDLTPVPPGLSRLRRCAVALAVSGIAGLVVDDGAEAAPPAARGPDGAEVLRQRLAAVTTGWPPARSTSSSACGRGQP